MAVLRLFAAARVSAGTARDTLPGATVGDVLDGAVARYGPSFAAVLDTSAVWLNGSATTRSAAVGPDDEIGILPPLSGGAT